MTDPEDRARHWAKVLGKRLLADAIGPQGTRTLWSEDMARVVILNAITEVLARDTQGKVELLRQAARAMCNQMCGPCQWPTKRGGSWQHLRDSVSTLGLPCWAYVPCKAGPIHDLIAQMEAKP